MTRIKKIESFVNGGNSRFLNSNEIKNYLNYPNNSTLQEKWLVIKLDENSNCLDDISKSKIISGGRRKSLNKSKKYARKTIRKHKSRKNRN